MDTTQNSSASLLRPQGAGAGLSSSALGAGKSFSASIKDTTVDLGKYVWSEWNDPGLGIWNLSKDILGPDGTLSAFRLACRPGATCARQCC